LAAINVTPLVDVMLVLLILFLLTASLETQGITVKLPQATAAQVQAPPPVVVTVDAALKLWVNQTVTDRNSLTAVLKAQLEAGGSKVVSLKADRSVTYGDFVDVVDRIKAAGVDQLSLVTDPPRD
jgi:biopolymer transport protein TolR